MKLYGNLMNRLAENQPTPIIEVDMNITMYYYSDRTCYYVTKVIDQRCIEVRPYFVCADKSKAGGMGHQDWMYFKTAAEINKYLRTDDFTPAYEDRIETWVYRYNKWMRRYTCTEENYCTERELKSLQKYGYYYRYAELSGKVGFGVRNYHYDWEF